MFDPDNTSMKIQNLSDYKFPPHTSMARRQVDWTKFNNANLKFTFELLSLHQSHAVYEALLEIQRRIASGIWLELEKPPPPLHSVPEIFHHWPLCLLWKQREGRWGRG